MGKLSRFIASFLILNSTLLIVTLPSQAEVVYNLIAPFNLTVEINCDGNLVDVVDLSGELHVLTIVTDKNGTLSAKSQFVARDVTGIGEISGANYRGVGLTFDRVNFVVDHKLGYTLVNNFYIIGQSGGTRYLVHQTLHFIQDADGNLVVFHDNATVTCPGI